MADVIEAILTAVHLEDDPRVAEFRVLQDHIIEAKERLDGDVLSRARSALDRLRLVHPELYDALLRELTSDRSNVDRFDTAASSC